MDLEYHRACLHKLCSVCGTIITSQRVTHKCEDHREKLWKYLKVNTEGDHMDVHPPRMCNNCYRAMTRSAEKGEHYHSSVKIVHWDKHSDSNCNICTRYKQKSVGGRPKKRKHNLSEEGQVTSAAFLRHISSFEADLVQYRAHKPLEVTRFLPPNSPICLEDFICPLCKMVVDKPVETTCDHMVCHSCISKWLYANDPSCPVCLTKFRSTSDVKAASTVAKNILASLQIRCDHCPIHVPLSQLASHLNQCSTDQPVSLSLTPTSGPPTPSKVSLRSVLTSPVELPPSDVEIRAATHLVRRILRTQEQTLLSLPTGGQVRYTQTTPYTI